jgi:hypothetical protein
MIQVIFQQGIQKHISDGISTVTDSEDERGARSYLMTETTADIQYW